MKKLITLITCLCVLAIGLCACGNTSGTDSQTTASSETTPTNVIAEDAYIVGDFAITIPDGWMVYPQPDVFAEKQKDGSSPTRKDAIGLIKDGKSELDAFSKPVVYLYSFNTSAEEQVKNSITDSTAESLFSEINEIDVSINDIVCMAYEVKQPSFLDENASYVYQYIFYPIAENQCVQIIIPVDMIDFEGVTYEDEGVQEIIQSIQLVTE